MTDLTEEAGDICFEVLLQRTTFVGFGSLAVEAVDVTKTSTNKPSPQ